LRPSPFPSSIALRSVIALSSNSPWLCRVRRGIYACGYVILVYVGNRCGNRVSSVRDFTVRPLLCFFCPRVAYIRSSHYARLMNEFSMLPSLSSFSFFLLFLFLFFCRRFLRFTAEYGERLMVRDTSEIAVKFIAILLAFRRDHSKKGLKSF